MPPNFIEIVITATGNVASWLWSYAEILVKATPNIAGIPSLAFFIAGGFLIIMAKHHDYV